MKTSLSGDASIDPSPAATPAVIQALIDIQKLIFPAIRVEKARLPCISKGGSAAIYRIVRVKSTRTLVLLLQYSLLMPLHSQVCGRNLFTCDSIN